MKFDKEKYKIWELPHPIILHWIINPGLAFNELVLGQRIPRVSLIDKTSNAPLMEKTYIPCEHCNTLNDGRLWSGKNGFGHWFGYVCPVCGGKIKCLWNITSILILIITSPIWIWFKIFFEQAWLEKEKDRFNKVLTKGLPKAKTTSWLKMGIIFGIVMFVLMNISSVITRTISIEELIFSSICCVLGGVVFGFLMYLLTGRKQKKREY